MTEDEGEDVHLLHFNDGYPLCWPMDKDGNFKGSFDEADVTCLDCMGFMKEEK